VSVETDCAQPPKRRTPAQRRGRYRRRGARPEKFLEARFLEEKKCRGRRDRRRWRENVSRDPGRDCGLSSRCYLPSSPANCYSAELWVSKAYLLEVIRVRYKTRPCVSSVFKSVLVRMREHGARACWCIEGRARAKVGEEKVGGGVSLAAGPQAWDLFTRRRDSLKPSHAFSRTCGRVLVVRPTCSGRKRGKTSYEEPGGVNCERHVLVRITWTRITDAIDAHGTRESVIGVRFKATTIPGYSTRKRINKSVE